MSPHSLIDGSAVRHAASAHWWDRAETRGTADRDAKAMKVHAAIWYRAGKKATTGLTEKVPRVDEKSKRVMRGGSWYEQARWARSANRSAQVPNDVSERYSFRICLEPTP